MAGGIGIGIFALLGILPVLLVREEHHIPAIQVRTSLMDSIGCVFKDHEMCILVGFEAPLGGNQPEGVIFAMRIILSAGTIAFGALALFALLHYPRCEAGGQNIGKAEQCWTYRSKRHGND